MKQNLTIGLVIIAILNLFPGSAALAAENPGPTGQAGNGIEDPEALEAFLDDFFSQQMDSLNVPGAVIVVVQQDKVLLQKGYGFSSLEPQVPVDPQQTIFRAGSISKLFVTTAVLQLVEQGLVDLEAPIRGYLPEIAFENPFPVPVTVAHLLTHTGGFDDKMAGMGTTDPEGLQPLASYLADNMPPVVIEPGDQISYSNHGFALAGLLVERVSGMPFAEYAAANIFEPLGMSDSSFAEPTPPLFESRLATGYAFSNGSYITLPPSYLNVAPAGSLISTAPDMARYMIANLNAGTAGSPFLSFQSLAAMHSQQFSQHPDLPGWAYGFYEDFENGRRALAHGGDLPGFSSLLYLLPDEKFGFFVSVNTALNPIFSGDLREALASQMLDRFFPGSNDTPVKDVVNSDLSRFEGKYRWNRYVRTTAFKGLPPSPLLQFRIRSTPDGLLEMSPPLGIGDTVLWEQIGDLLFKEAGGDTLMAFREDENGGISHQFLTHFGQPIAAEKVSWNETDGFQIGLLSGILVIFLTTLAWPLSGIAGRLFGKTNTRPSGSGVSRRFAGITVTLGGLFLVGLVALVGQVSLSPFSPVPAYFSWLLALPLATLLLLPFLAWIMIRAWRRRAGSLFGRLHTTIVITAVAAFVWFTAYWNLMGWQ